MGLDIYHVKPSLLTNETIEYLTLDEFQNNPNFVENHKDLITYIFDENGKKTPVIYYLQEGHQRNQTKKEFRELFENEILYFDIDSVKKAKTYLKANNVENQIQLEQKFQVNFLDNFIEGKSIFFISY
jgi:hypothetical protein